LFLEHESEAPVSGVEDPLPLHTGGDGLVGEIEEFVQNLKIAAAYSAV
jgi:hypothetical protein